MIPTLCRSGICYLAGIQVLAAPTSVASPVDTTESEKHCGVPRAVQFVAQRKWFVFVGSQSFHISVLVPLTRAEMAEQNYFLPADYEIAHPLNNVDGGGSGDEGGEEQDFGLGAIDHARMPSDGVPVVRVLAFEVERSQRAARRASSNKAASFAMSEHSWSANDRTAARFLRFLVLTYAPRQPSELRGGHRLGVGVGQAGHPAGRIGSAHAAGDSRHDEVGHPFSPSGPLYRSCTPCGRKLPSLCLPPTQNETMSPGSTTERVKRGLSFSPGEDLALALWFASTTLSTTDMTSCLC